MEEKEKPRLQNDFALKALAAPYVELKARRDTFKEEFIKRFDDKYLELVKQAQGGETEEIRGKAGKIKKILDMASLSFGAASAISAVAAVPSGPAPILGAFSAGAGLIAVLASGGATVAQNIGIRHGQEVAIDTVKTFQKEHVRKLVMIELATNLSILFEYQLSQLADDEIEVGRMARGAVNRLFRAIEEKKSKFCTLNLLLAIVGKSISQPQDRHEKINILNTNPFLKYHLNNQIENPHWYNDNIFFKAGVVQFSPSNKSLFKTSRLKEINRSDKYGYRHSLGTQFDNEYQSVDQDAYCPHQLFFSDKIHSVFIKVDQIGEYSEICLKEPKTPTISEYFISQYVSSEKTLFTPLNIVGRELNFSILKNLQKLSLAKIDLCYANFHGVNLANTILSEANLIGAIFIDANLTGTKLVHACLAGANFQNATIDDADLSYSDLTGANLLVRSLNGNTNLEHVVCSGLKYNVNQLTLTRFLSDDLLIETKNMINELALIDGRKLAAIGRNASAVEERNTKLENMRQLWKI